VVPYFLAPLSAVEPACSQLISTDGTAASVQARERISSAVWAAVCRDMSSQRLNSPEFPYGR
jgi:hypothetical protein